MKQGRHILGQVCHGAVDRRHIGLSILAKKLILAALAEARAHVSRVQLILEARVALDSIFAMRLDRIYTSSFSKYPYFFLSIIPRAQSQRLPTAHKFLTLWRMLPS